MSKKKQNYDDSMKEIQSILAQLQEGKIGLEEMREQVARAMQLISSCREQLREVREEIDQVTTESAD